MELDGEQIVSNEKKKKTSEALTKGDLEDIDEFNLAQWLPILEQVADEKGVGQMGERPLAVLKENIGFHQEDVSEKTPYSNDWDILSKDTKFHPLRPIQKQVLDKIQEAIDEGYENIIVECPVGSGKSAIAKTIPQNYASPAYIVTHLKGLQAQYLKEMPYMSSIMGKGNYDCMLDVEAGLDDLNVANEALENVGTTSPGSCSAALAPCKFTNGFKCSFKNPVSPVGEWDFGVPTDNLCSYFSALTKAQNSMYFVGNTAYLMAMNQSGKVLKERPFLIVDEAHQLAKNMMSFYSLNISQRVLEKIFRVPSATDVKNEKSEMKRKTLIKQRERITKQFDSTDASPCFGIPKIPSVSLQTTPEQRKKGLQVLGRYLFALHEAIKLKMKDKDPHTKYEKRELSYVNNFALKIMGLLASISTSWENWVYQLDDKEEFPSWISFKPLDVSPYAENLLLNLGHRRIFLSGTILDHEIFGKELGLNQETTCYIKVDYSPFKEENRPVFSSVHGGKLSKSHKGAESFEKTAQAIADIAAKYPDEKGLILPYTDSIEAGVVEALKTNHPLVHARIRQHTKDSRERESVFREFEQEKNNEILISTYANQGFDGKMVGFTIVPKVPFGPLGDIQVKTKAETNPKWYAVQTAIELAQMCGRCVRSADDVGHTYIIDPSFWFHFERGFNYPLAKLLPSYLATTILRNRYRK